MSRQIKVHKLDDKGRQVWSYQGSLLSETDTQRVLEARFDRGPVRVSFLEFEPGDRMVEYFYSDHWYNIFEVYDRQDKLKGWYCNLARPAKFTAEAIEQEDLALDLIVSPAGETVLLDEEEFEALNLSEVDRQQAERGLAELKRRVTQRQAPFDKVQA